jgi:hypothetical protein
MSVIGAGHLGPKGPVIGDPKPQAERPSPGRSAEPHGSRARRNPLPERDRAGGGRRFSPTARHGGLLGVLGLLGEEGLVGSLDFRREVRVAGRRPAVPAVDVAHHAGECLGLYRDYGGV